MLHIDDEGIRIRLRELIVSGFKTISAFAKSQEMHPSQVSGYLNGDREMGSVFIKKLAELNFDLNYIYKGIPSNKSHIGNNIAKKNSQAFSNIDTTNFNITNNETDSELKTAIAELLMENRSLKKENQSLLEQLQSATKTEEHPGERIQNPERRKS